MNVQGLRASGARDPWRRIQMALMFSGTWREMGQTKQRRESYQVPKERRFGGACRSKQYFEWNTTQPWSTDGNGKPAQALETGTGGIAKYVSLQKPFPPSFKVAPVHL